MKTYRWVFLIVGVLLVAVVCWLILGGNSRSQLEKYKG